MRIFRTAALCAACFVAGAQVREYFSGSVRVFTNVDEGTPLNHGQKSVEITLPRGLRFTSFGDCHPEWVSASGKIKWSRLTAHVERFDVATGSFKPHPFAGGWYENER